MSLVFVVHHGCCYIQKLNFLYYYCYLYNYSVINWIRSLVYVLVHVLFQSRSILELLRATIATVRSVVTVNRLMLSER